MTDFKRPSKTEAKDLIKDLTQRYFKFEETYKSQKHYNEAQIRVELINPFFKALGWNVDNAGLDPDKREVIVETSVEVYDELTDKQKAIKHPDYGFYHKSPNAKFYVEAKHPSVNLSTKPEPAFQLRRYAYSDRLPVSIITDFEEFVVYDCTVQPRFADKNVRGFQLKYLTYHNYVKEFDYLWEHFSYEAVEEGRFDAFVKKDTKRRGISALDLDFVQSLDQWRELLARDIFQNNPSIETADLNFSVQTILDRIIFLRVCEDREIEPYEQLKGVFQKNKSYQNLVKDFERATLRYNSDLFNFQKDTVTAHLKISDATVESIINDLYVPNSPYVFKIIPVEILGNAYERFLGKTITVNAKHQIVIEEKPEVRKAGGVFYTPQYIVNYIVENTVGRLVEGKTPEQVAELSVLDPSCGSGSFLIGAYQFLLDWHKQYYQQNAKKYTKTKVKPFRTDGSLTNAERKRILLNNIYGVDLDPQAVEVAKLSLLLKALEGETAESVRQLASAFERVLPSLDENLRCGNSLIANDLKKATPSVSDAEEAAIRPFDWQKTFGDVFDKGGFDAVVGNPPYVMLQNQDSKIAFEYCSKKYDCAIYKIDMYQIFIEQSVKVLLKQGGFLGYITPNTFLKNVHSQPLRRVFLERTKIREFVLFNYRVFEAASVDTCVFIVEKKQVVKNKLVVYQANVAFEPIEVSEIEQSSLASNNRLDFDLMISSSDDKILDKVSKISEPLMKYCDAYFGIQTFDRTKYVSKIKLTKQYEPVIDGGNIDFYRLKPAIEYVKYVPEAIKSGGNEKVYRQERICMRQIGAIPVTTIVPANIFTLNTIYNVYRREGENINLRFLLGLINSNLIRFFWKKKNSDEKKTFPKIKKEGILSIPIRIINSKDKNDKDSHDEIVNLVEKMMELKIDVLTVDSVRDRERLEKKIKDTETSINAHVYKLYDLTAAEIALIESV